jgi:hypothetical protein
MPSQPIAAERARADSVRDKARTARMREALSEYETATATEDAAADALQAQLAEWRTSSHDTALVLVLEPDALAIQTSGRFQKSSDAHTIALLRARAAAKPRAPVRIDLSARGLEALPQWLLSPSALPSLPGVGGLGASHAALAAIVRLDCVQELSLVGNSLTSLPDALARACPRLAILNLVSRARGCRAPCLLRLCVGTRAGLCLWVDVSDCPSLEFFVTICLTVRSLTVRSLASVTEHTDGG